MAANSLQQGEGESESTEAEPGLSLDLSLGGLFKLQPSISSTSRILDETQKNSCIASLFPSTMRVHQPNTSASPDLRNTLHQIEHHILARQPHLFPTMWDNILGSSTPQKQNPQQFMEWNRVLKKNLLQHSPAASDLNMGPLKRKEICQEVDIEQQQQQKKKKKKRARAASYGGQHSACSSSVGYVGLESSVTSSRTSVAANQSAQSMNLLFEAVSYKGLHVHETASEASRRPTQTSACPSSYSQVSFRTPNPTFSASYMRTRQHMNGIRESTIHDMPPNSSMEQKPSLHAEKDGATSCHSTLSSEDIEIGCPNNLLGKSTAGKVSVRNFTSASSLELADQDQSNTSRNHRNEFDSPRSRCGSNSDIIGSMDSSSAVTRTRSSSGMMHANHVIPASMFSMPGFLRSSSPSAPSAALQNGQKEGMRPAYELALGLPCAEKDPALLNPSNTVRESAPPHIGAMPELSVDIQTSALRKACSRSCSLSAQCSEASSHSLSESMSSQASWKERGYKPSLVCKVVDEGLIGQGPHKKPVKTVRFCGVDKAEASCKPISSKGDSVLSSHQNDRRSSDGDDPLNEGGLKLLQGRRVDVVACMRTPAHGAGNSANTHESNKLGAAATGSMSKKGILPCVSTTGVGPKGKTIHGVMYISEQKQACLVCSCHGTHMTPEGFVQHSGSSDLSNPERRIVVEYFPFAGGLTTSLTQPAK